LVEDVLAFPLRISYNPAFHSFSWYLTMKIELTTEQQQQLLREQQEDKVEVVAPATEKRYVLISEEEYECIRGVVVEQPGRTARGIPAGIRASQEAYWRDLPRLLELHSESQQWVAYHGDEQVAFGRTMAELYEVCLQRGLAPGEFYVDRLQPRALPPWEEETIQTGDDSAEADYPA